MCIGEGLHRVEDFLASADFMCEVKFHALLNSCFLSLSCVRDVEKPLNACYLLVSLHLYLNCGIYFATRYFTTDIWTMLSHRKIGVTKHSSPTFLEVLV